MEERKSKKRLIILLAIIAAAAITAGIVLHRFFYISRNVDISGDIDIEEHILTESPNYNRSGRLPVRGLMLHSVGMAVADAETFTEIFGAPDYERAGVHAFIDAKTGVVYHTLPWNQVAWHCGGDAVLTHIGVEMCETDAAYYDDDGTLQITNSTQAKKDCKTAYDSAVKLFARLCDEYDLDPLADGVVISHREGAYRGVASSHEDPEHYWDAVGLGYTMDGFREDVYNVMRNM